MNVIIRATLVVNKYVCGPFGLLDQLTLQSSKTYTGLSDTPYLVSDLQLLHTLIQKGLSDLPTPVGLPQGHMLPYLLIFTLITESFPLAQSIRDSLPGFNSSNYNDIKPCIYLLSPYKGKENFKLKH